MAGLPPSSTEIATISNVLPAIFLLSFIMDGISSRQGGHQVAQKLSRTTLPRRSDNFRVFPLASDITETSGAGVISFTTALLLRYPSWSRRSWIGTGTQ